MKKILQINSKPYLHAYTQHGYFHAIAGAHDKVCRDTNETVAEVYVHDYEKYDWKEQTDQLTYYCSSDGKLCFTANKWNIGMNMAFWRECKKTMNCQY